MIYFYMTMSIFEDFIVDSIMPWDSSFFNDAFFLETIK